MSCIWNEFLDTMLIKELRDEVKYIDVKLCLLRKLDRPISIFFRKCILPKILLGAALLVVEIMKMQLKMFKIHKK